MRRALVFAVTACTAVALVAGLGCRRGKDLSQMEPVVVVLGPTFDAARAPKQFEPLKSHLETTLEKPFQFRPTKTREECANLVREGKASFIFANPMDYAEVSDGCIVLVKANYAGKGSMTQGGIIVKEGEATKIRDVPEMKGSTMMVVSKSSLDGYLSQKMFFSRSGLDIDLDFNLSEAPNQSPADVVAAVAGGQVQYGCVPADLYPAFIDRKPVNGVELLTVCEKVPVEVFAFVEASGDKMLGGEVRDALRKIPKNDPIFKPLGLENFTVATQAEYDAVTNFLAQDKIDKAQRMSGTPAGTATAK